MKSWNGHIQHGNTSLSVLEQKKPSSKAHTSRLKKLGDCVRLIHDIKDPRVPSSIYAAYWRSVHQLWTLLWVARNCDCLNFNESPPCRIQMNSSNGLFADTRSQAEKQHDLHIKRSFLLYKEHRITTLSCRNISFISKSTFGSIRERLFSSITYWWIFNWHKTFHNFQ